MPRKPTRAGAKNEGGKAKQLADQAMALAKYAARALAAAGQLRVKGRPVEGFQLLDPGAFDPAAATRAMRRGLPDWRRMC
jgi:hypothetical protein